MLTLDVAVENPAAVIGAYGAGALVRAESSATETGTYAEFATAGVEVGQTSYAIADPAGVAGTWYRTRYSTAVPSAPGDYSSFSAPFQASGGIYASLTAFKAFIRNTDPADDALALMSLETASRVIDMECGRRFDLAGAQTARVFPPDGRYGMRIDDTFDAMATVMFDTSGGGEYTTAVTDFRLGPSNAPTRGMPYTELVVNGRRTRYGIQVTASWGWPTVPITIANATLLQASRFIKRRDAPFGIAGSPELGSELRLLARLDPDVAVMVGPYRRWSGFVVVGSDA